MRSRASKPGSTAWSSRSSRFRYGSTWGLPVAAVSGSDPPEDSAPDALVEARPAARRACVTRADAIHRSSTHLGRRGPSAATAGGAHIRDDGETAMSETPKLLLQKDGPIGWIIFNQPEKRNAVSLEMWQRMPEYVHELSADDAIRVVVLRGAGDQAFVAGADISQFKERRRNMADQEEYSRISEKGQSALGTLTKPLLAMIHGYCVGGGVGIAIGCDLRIASDD